MYKIVLWLLLILCPAQAAFAGGCLSGETWTTSWTDPLGQTVYTLEAPVEACIGVAFNIVVTVADASYPNDDVGGLWALKDNGVTIAGGGFNWITTASGQWQRIISRTYSGAPIDHTLTFTFTDYGAGGGAHNYAGSTIGAIILDPYVAPLPQTGQTVCWDSSGRQLPCTDPLAAGQDGAARAGEPWPEPRFVDNGDGTVTDNLTGLAWAQDAATPTHADCVGGELSWPAALAYVTCLNDSQYLGYADWRLPNINELASLPSKDLVENVYWLTSSGFTGVEGVDYLSSSFSMSVGTPVPAFAVNMGNGGMALRESGKVWPVRRDPLPSATVPLPQTGQLMCVDPFEGYPIECFGSGQDGETQAGIFWPDPRFEIFADQTVTDNLTGLVWPSDASTPVVGPCVGGAMPWAAALDYVACLNSSLYLGHNDWRVPNVHELASLLSKQTPFGIPLWLGDNGILAVQPVPYWSATTDANAVFDAWHGDLALGLVATSAKTENFHVLPVRGGTLNPPPPPSAYALSVGTVGSGSVSSAPAGIDCGQVCSADFNPGTEVTLNAAPAAGFAFAGWTGDCAGTGDCTVTMDAARNVTATFEALLPCGSIRGIYGPNSVNRSGTYRISWEASSTPGVEYVLTENGGVVGRTANRYWDFAGKLSGAYDYAVKAVKAGYADSPATGAHTVTVVLSCGPIGGIYGTANSKTGNYRIYWDASSGTPGVEYVLTENGAEVGRTVNRYWDFAGKGNGSYGYVVKATKPGYLDSAAKGPFVANVVLTCANISGIYGPANNATGSYRISWSPSSTPEASYVLTENGVPVYTGASLHKDFANKPSGNYVYAVKAIRAGYVDSAVKEKAALVVAR